MKRSDFFIRLTTGLLFLAVACYIGVYIYNAIGNTYATTTAVSYSIEETFSAQGYIVRTEIVLADMGSEVLPVVSEGERVASGQAVAVEYLSQEALETAGEIRALRLKIAQLATPAAGSETARLNSVLGLSYAIQSGDLSKLDEISLNIETNIFKADQAADAGLPALQARLETLERRIEGVRTIHAPVSGTFSQILDGFEHVGPAMVSDISPAGLTELFTSAAGAGGFGKLVTEFKWYFAAQMDEDDAIRLTAGRRIPVQFSGAYNAVADMLIEKVGKYEDSQCVVLFSSDRSIHEVAQLRQLRAEAVYDTVTGIRVPKEAIHLDDDGTTFIFLQTGVRAERVNVEILIESGGSYLVRDGAEAGTPLRAGSTIIVKANNLFDGKVVA